MHGWETRMLLRHYLQRGVSKAALARRFGVSRRTIHAHSGEIDRPFRWQVDHLFRRKSITCQSEATRDENHEFRFSVRVDGRPRFRMESPFSSSL